jgi:hypothetical protein
MTESEREMIKDLSWEIRTLNAHLDDVAKILREIASKM